MAPHGKVMSGEKNYFTDWKCGLLQLQNTGSDITSIKVKNLFKPVQQRTFVENLPLN